MVEVTGVLAEVGQVYSEFLLTLPGWLQIFINLFLLVLVVVLYAIVIWKLYRFIARRDVIKLNLNKYNRAKNPLITKTVAGVFYFIENIIIFPFLIFMWYALFTLFILVLTETPDAGRILIISAVIVGAIRVAAYYKEDLAKDLGKLLPFTLLAVYLFQLTKFDLPVLLGKIVQIPTLFSEILTYFLFLLALEIVLRIISLFFIASGVEDEEEVKLDD